MHFYRQYHPSALLADFVECYWIFRSSTNILNNPERLIPGGRIEMMFNFSDPLQWLITNQGAQGTLVQGSFVMGPRDRIYYAQSTGNTDILGVRFKPGGLTPFTGVPISAILNQIVPAEYIFGNNVKVYQELLYEKKKDENKIQLLDKLLMQSLKNINPDLKIVNHALETMRNSHDITLIHSICDEAGWYYKKLERAFQKHAGYTPKHYYKIVRFNKALRMMANNANKSLTHICYDCNYFDQSHFIKDFRQLAGTTPGNFKKENNRIASFLIKYQSV